VQQVHLLPADRLHPALAQRPSSYSRSPLCPILHARLGVMHPYRQSWSASPIELFLPRDKCHRTRVLEDVKDIPQRASKDLLPPRSFSYDRPRPIILFYQERFGVLFGRSCSVLTLALLLACSEVVAILLCFPQSESWVPLSRAFLRSSMNFKSPPP